MTDSLKERLAKLSGAGFNPIYSEALARIEELERDTRQLDDTAANLVRALARIEAAANLVRALARIEELEAEVKQLFESNGECAATIAKLEAENKRMREALEKLGAPENDR